MAASASVEVEVAGRRLSLSNLDKVLYPEAGFTKAEVIDYYARIAPTMVPHLAGRALTFKRYPNGVEGQAFFEKRCPSHRPPWVPVARGPGGGTAAKDTVDYCVIEETASLVWAANLAALELHSPMALAQDLERPRMCVFDLDPGPPAAIPDCGRVALEIREILASFDLLAFAKTSGSKGMQIYIPLNTDGANGVTHEEAASFALAVGQRLENQHPDRVLTSMKRDLRPGKVFVDWSQNARHKTTIAPYSLRARPRPTVSTPVSWDEVEAAAGGEMLSFEATDVLARVDELGDLFAPTLELEQHLPKPKAGKRP